MRFFLTTVEWSFARFSPLHPPAIRSPFRGLPGVNSEAQSLTRFEAEMIIADPQARDRVFRSFELMLDFWGFAYNRVRLSHFACLRREASGLYLSFLFIFI